MKIGFLTTEYHTNPIGIATQRPRLSWKLESEHSATVQTHYQLLAAHSEEDLNQGNYSWDSGKVQSKQSVHVEYSGSELHSSARVFWKVKVWNNHSEEAESAVAFWEMGLLQESEWAADWITFSWENVKDHSTPNPYFRKDFKLEKEVKSARLYATALGLYELELNGHRVGDQVFTPGWTNYHQRLQYQVYDVTNLINLDENALGAIIGDGWYSGHFGWWWPDNRNAYGDQIALLAQLKITYSDGSEVWIGTDASWKCASGPILKSDIYNGETYDARLEMSGWSSPGFRDQDWKNAQLYQHTKNPLIASEGDPVRKIQELKPVSFFTTPNGEQVFDLGQNMVGWARLKVSGAAGTEVTLRFAEVLDQYGNFYTDNLRKIECTDRYILKGEGKEIYEPRFTFHGFRYVMVSGFPSDLTEDAITGIVIHSDMQPTGEFSCSDPLINQLQSNIQWGQKGNFLDVPTDCPQRDERLGWTGDAQAFAPTASFNFNTAPFFTKWLKDLATEQKPDGSVPWVVPNIIVDGGGTGWSDGFGATGWADAAVVIPWVLYQTYGDRRIIEQQFDSMKAWVDYMIHHAGDQYIFDYGFHFGDWLSFAEYESYNYNAPDYGFAGAHTDKALIATAYFYYSAGLLSKMAAVIGRNDVANSLNQLLPKIKKAWNDEFVTKTGRLVSSTQAAYAIGLMFGIVEGTIVPVIAKRLADDVSYFGHLTTGFLGTPVLNYALSDFGNTALAYQLLHNDRYPSWLYPVTKGATTIWERWDGIRPDGTFQTVGMNSFNHYAYGAIGEWLYSRVVGIQIDPEKPGYEHIIFHPHPGGKLTHAQASIETMYGKVSAGWIQKNGSTTYTVVIPANTSGHVILDGVKSEDVLVNGAKSAKVSSTDSGVIISLMPGKYTIVW